MTPVGRHRLTSWKEIATHVGRDVRTVLRWEKDRGLPIHRIPGATGRVVFAYTDELDLWASGYPPEAAAAPVIEAPALPAPRSLAPPRKLWWIAAALTVFVATWAAWTAQQRREPQALTLQVASDGITGVGRDGTVQWRHAFPQGERATLLKDQQFEVTDMGNGGLVAATHVHTLHTDVRGGQLYWFSRAGELRRTFAFNDQLTFSSGDYGSPWAVTGFRVEGADGRGRTAVAAHHHEWWPSMVTVLDAGWKRQATFVNAGWIERVMWAGDDRLVISGFSNPGEAGMLALLDANSLDGQSPAVPNKDYGCTSCGVGRPLRYILLPRSEVNLTGFSPFNRVILQKKPNGFLAETEETTAVPGPPGLGVALFEFTADLRLVRATYGDRYWEIHRRLEAQGRLTHTREQCPERDGPREIRVWEPAHGWKTESISRARVQSTGPPQR